MRFLAILALVAVMGLSAPRGAEAGCAVGDLPCACAQAGGRWRDLKKPLEPTCTVTFKHQGRDRTFNIFFPRNYNPSKAYPVWVHMHGVYWATMGDISRTMNYTVPSSDATPVWDTLATGSYRDAAIIIYPQATSPYGDLNRRTFWSIPFWRCSVGDCIDSSIDDVGYVEAIFNQLPARANVDPKRIYITGTSAGGMMLENLLCSSSLISSKIAAAVDIIGGIGTPMKGKCAVPAAATAAGRRRVPFRILHGTEDSVLYWDRPTVVDGAPFLSTKEAGAMWKDLYGCAADADRQVWADKTTTCTSLCDPSKGRTLDLCGMKGVGHDLNTPYQGYPFSVAWDFLSKYTNDAAKKEGKREKPAKKEGKEAKEGKKEGAKKEGPKKEGPKKESLKKEKKVQY